MGVAIFVIIAILFLFGLPIILTLSIGKIAMSVKEKKEKKENEAK